VQSALFGGGANFFGDSATYAGADAAGCASGDQNCNTVGELVINSYGGLGAAYPRALSNFSDAAYGNSLMMNCLDDQILPNTDYGDSGSPDTFIQCGEADALAQSPAGALTNDIVGAPGPLYNAALTAAIAWTGTAHFGRTYASNGAACVKTGSWAADDQFHAGVALAATAAGATLTCTAPYPVGTAVVGVWHVFSNSTAAATFAIDGTVVDTWSAGAAGSIATVPGDNSTWWGARYPLTGAPAVHIFTVTVTAASPSMPFSVAFFASPKPEQNWLGLTFPRLYVGGVEAAASPTESGFFDTYTRNTVQQLKTDGWNVTFVDVNAAWPDTTSPITGTTYPDGRVCTASTIGSPHPGTCGHLFWSWAYLRAAGKFPGFAGVDSVFGRGGVVSAEAGDYTAAQVVGAAATNTANTFSGGTQSVVTASPSTVGLVIKGSTGVATPTYVQGLISTGNAAVFAGTVTAGNTVIVVNVTSGGCKDAYTNAPLGAVVTDSLGSTFTNVLVNQNSSDETYTVSTALLASGGADTVTAVPNCASTEATSISEYSGVGAFDSSAVNQFNSYSGTMPQPSVLGPIATTATGDLLFSYFFGERPINQSTYTAGVGYTQRLALTSPNTLVIEDSIAGQAGSYETQWSASAPYFNDFALLAFKPQTLTSQVGNLLQFESPAGALLSAINGQGQFTGPDAFDVSTLAGNGSMKLPSGFTLQWGTAASLGDNTPTTVTFNGSGFAHQCFAVLANDNSAYATAGNPRSMGTKCVSATQFTIEASGSGASAFWIAVGY
jgi:hypothetical protein